LWTTTKIKNSVLDLARGNGIGRLRHYSAMRAYRDPAKTQQGPGRLPLKSR